MQSGIHEDEPIEEDNDAIFESNYAWSDLEKLLLTIL